jgi:excisionase family DNA binding protein
MEEIEPIYISLKEATQYCNYSQEYLSLRARQGKLKAVKLGRNWLTKKEWLENYLRRVEMYKNRRVASPPENLPIGEFPIIQSAPKFRFNFIFSLIFVLLVLIVGIIFGSKVINENLAKNFPETKFLATINIQDVFKTTLDTFREFGQWLSEFIPK